jgi:hypothetical protein
MLAGGAPSPTGKKTSCPEQAISVVQLGAAVGIVVGLPSVVTVVAKVVVDVLEATIVVSTSVKDVDVAVTVLSNVDVNVELFSVIVITSLVTDKNVEMLSRGKVVTVDSVTMLSTVLVGTEMVCVVVDWGSSVVLVNGANVVSGSRVEAVTEGKLVGNG